MLQLTPIERTVFEVVFLFDYINYSRICDIIQYLRHERSLSTETGNTVHWALKRLVKNNLITSSTRGGTSFYLSSDQEHWDILMELFNTPEFQQMVGQCEALGKYLEKIVYGNINGMLRRLYMVSCAFRMLHDRVSEAEIISERYAKEDKESCYWERKYIPFNAFRAGLIYLFSFPEFRAKAKELPDNLILKLFPEYLLLSVLYGTELPDLEQLFNRAILPLQMQNIPSFLLAAFWTGDRKMLKEIFVTSDIRSLSEACLAGLNGDWKTADQRFTRYLNDAEFTSNREDPLNTLLIITALFPACVCSAAQTRMNKYYDYLTGNKCLSGLPSLHRDFYILSEAFRTNFCTREDGLDPDIPFTYLLRMMLSCISPQQKTLPEDVQKGLELGKKLLEKDHVTSAVWLLNAAGSLLSPEDPERNNIAGLAEKYQVAPLLAITVPKKEWENTLTALEKLFPETAVPEKGDAAPREGKIAWVVSKEEYRVRGSGKKYSVFNGVNIFFLPVTKRGGYGIAKKVSFRKFLRGGIDVWLSQEELKLKLCVRKDYYEPDEMENRALDILQKSDSVYFSNLEHPVKLVREENSILSQISPGGWVKLSLKYHPDDMYSSDIMTFFDLSEEGVCRFCHVTGDDRLIRFFNAYGKNGVVSIPQEGTKAVADTLSKISKRIPVTGALSSDAYRDLPRKEGVAEIHAFLIREGALFTAEFRCHPCPEADWFVKPGCGIEQRLMGTGEKQYFLIRNLKEEQKVFYGMLEKCPSVPTSAKQEFVCDSDDPEQILMYLSELKEAGFVLDWNAEKPWKVSGTLDSSRLRLTGGSGIDWFAVGGELHVDDKTVLTLQQLFEALDRRTGNFIRLDDATYLRLTRDLMKKLELLRASGKVEKGKLEVSPAALPMLSSAFTSDLPEKLLEQMEIVRRAFETKITLPKGLRGELRPYQSDGYQYLARMADCRIGCCLADDMGLGKTIQLLTLLLREAHNGPALVVCPASLCRNWEREAQKFAPSLHTVLLPQFDREKIIQEAGKGDLLLCSYGIVQSESELFAGKAWHTVILDEAQAIKNYAAKRSKSAKTLQADIRIASTGTPVENNLLELWSIFDFLNPGLLGNAADFESKFCENDHPRPVLKKLVSPLIIRRRKQEVLEDLPPKTEITLTLELPEQERAMYEALRRRALEELQGNEESHIAILAQLTKLRRFCCDPSLVAPGMETGAKVRRLMELVQELKAAGHRALVFSQYVDFLSILRNEMEKEEITFQYLDGSTPPAQRMKAVDEFQNGNGDCFLISLKAGGTGLNLTAANYVILADPWWNPAVEDQAADRVHRIGQTDPVTVYRLIAADTVEERVLELHSRKKQVSDDILSDARSSGITAKELMSLFQEK